MTRFEWDEDKNQSNQRKHGVAFSYAVNVFNDPLHVTTINDVVGSELRWQTLGFVDGVAFVLVIHCDRSTDDDEVIRIISARRATSQERRLYER